MAPEELTPDEAAIVTRWWAGKATDEDLQAVIAGQIARMLAAERAEK